jgi:hypothetical protein
MSLTGYKVTRFPEGVNNLAVGSIFNDLPFPSELGYHVFFDDFDSYTAGDRWTVTETDAGAGQALTPGDGGIIALANSATDNHIDQIQTVANFDVVLGKKLFIQARFALDDVVESDFAIGIQNVMADGTTLATATDGVFFLKPDAAATLNFHFRQSNADAAHAATVAGIATLVNNTYVVVAAYYDGGDRCYYAINGVIGGYLTIATTHIPNLTCGVVASLKNGEGAAKTALIDYIYVAAER